MNLIDQKALSSKIGTYFETKKNFGFVKNNLGEEFFIPAKFTLNAITGDIVEIKLLNDLKPNTSDTKRKKSAMLIRILKRNGSKIVGEINQIDNELVFLPDEWKTKFKIRLIDIEKYQVGQVLITRFHFFKKNVVFLRVERIFSNKRTYKDLWKLLLERNNVELDFPIEVEKDAKKIYENNLDVDSQNRIDLTSEYVITIDGESSKDLDDAISVAENENNYILKIHIADVSNYIREDFSLDKFAKTTTSSIYFGSYFVLPMFPPIISNSLCSLNPNTEKLTLTCEVEVNKENGNLEKYSFFPSKIISKQRLTFDQASNYLNEKVSENIELKNFFKLAKKISNVIDKKLKENGKIEFKLDEIKIVLDNFEKPIGIETKTQKDSEKLIENFMIYANISAAKIINENNGLASFRNHIPPLEESLLKFVEVMKNIGMNDFLDLKNNELNINFFATIIEKIKLIQGPKKNIVLKFLLSCLEKAKYESINNGHFAIGCDAYVHFTSPIRRYSDIINHRKIKSIILKKKLSEENWTKENLDTLNRLFSEQEKKIINIEKKFINIELAYYLRNFIGKIVDCFVHNIFEDGVYLIFDDIFSGFIDNLNMQIFFEFDSRNNLYVDRNTKKVLNYGDQLVAKISKVDFVNGMIFLNLISKNTQI